MDKQELQRLLDELRGNIESTQPLDEDTRAMLRGLERDIQRVLDERHDQPETVRERLQDAVAQLEAEHPVLTRQLSVIIDTLSNLGI
jgi:hypothetical protein